MDSLSTTLEKCAAQLRPVLAYIALVSFFINLMILPISLYSLQVLDRVMATGSIPTLLWLTVIMIIMFVVVGVLQFLRGVMLHKTGDWLYRKLNKALLPITLSLASTGGSTVGSQGLRDVMQLKNFLSGGGITTLIDTPWSVLYILVLFLIHPLLGIMAFIGALLLIGLAWLNESAVSKPSKEAGAAQLKYTQEVEAASRNAEVIEAMGISTPLLGKWKRQEEEISILYDRAGSRASLLQGITKFTRLSLQVLVTCASGWLAVNGTITIGAIIAASILSSRALAPFEAAISGWKSWMDSKAAYGRLQELLQISLREEGMSLPAPLGALSVDKLSYAFQKESQPILKAVSFYLEPGESCGIIGPSGSGKSSLARLLTGAWKPVVGTVRLDGADVYSWPREEFGKYIGYLPQDIELFAGTVRENICRLQENAEPETIVQAARLAGAHELILHLPNGYDTEIGPYGTALSAGQRQRIGLARAFYGMPKFLVLDEPDANLDEEGQIALVRALKQAKLARITTVLVSHRRPILQHVDKILVLKNGSVAAFGPANEIMKEASALRQSTALKPRGKV